MGNLILDMFTKGFNFVWKSRFLNRFFFFLKIRTKIIFYFFCHNLKQNNHVLCTLVLNLLANGYGIFGIYQNPSRNKDK